MVKKHCCPECGSEYDSLFELGVGFIRIPDKSPIHGYYCPKCGARIA